MSAVDVIVETCANRLELAAEDAAGRWFIRIAITEAIDRARAEWRDVVYPTNAKVDALFVGDK